MEWVGLENKGVLLLMSQEEAFTLVHMVLCTKYRCLTITPQEAKAFFSHFMTSISEGKVIYNGDISMQWSEEAQQSVLKDIFDGN